MEQFVRKNVRRKTLALESSMKILEETNKDLEEENARVHLEKEEMMRRLSELEAAATGERK